MSQTELITQCKKLIQSADTIVIGAGAGLSTSAGVDYGGKRFKDNFPDFIEKYGLTDMYTSVFFPFPTPEERWAYFSRHIYMNRYTVPVGQVYYDLLKLCEHKNYFVITTNADAQFFRAGFDPEKIFAPQGEYSLFQCRVPCHDTLYNNEEMVKTMVEQQKNCRIPTELIPTCPICGEQFEAYIRKDDTFVENADWHKGQDRYYKFLQSRINDKSIVLLELGIGFNTPGIIRLPFEQFSMKYPNMTLARINYDHVDSTYDTPDSSILIQDDISRVISDLLK